MNRRLWCVVAVAAGLATGAPAVDWQELSAAQRLCADKRYEEALGRLKALADRTPGEAEQFQYLGKAIDIAVDSLHDGERAKALAAAVRDPARREYAQFQVLARLGKADEAWAFAQGKAIDAWPPDCRGEAHNLLAGLCRKRGDAAAAIGHYEQAAQAPATAPGVRGRAAQEAGALYLAKGDRAGAERMLRQALAISPAPYAWRCESLLTLSGLLIQDRRAAEAVALFDSIDFEKMEGGPWKPRLLEGYARALLAQGRTIKAVETYDQLLRSDIPAEWKARIEKELDKLAEDL